MQESLLKNWLTKLKLTKLNPETTLAILSFLVLLNSEAFIQNKLSNSSVYLSLKVSILIEVW